MFLVFFLGGGVKQNCGHFGHIARVCPNDAVQDFGFASRAPPPGRGLNMASLPPIKCYRCGGPNHMARYVATCWCYAACRPWLISLISALILCV